MADGTKIEWSDATWNPITGCSMVSDGCTHCYAMQLAGTRLKDHPSRSGLTRELSSGRHVWTGEVRWNEEWWNLPLRWKRPRRVFVCAHGDLFHEDVPDMWIDQVFAVMMVASQHTFQVLTKRPARMYDYLSKKETIDRVVKIINQSPISLQMEGFRNWPLPNVWLGTSVENQSTADERIPHLLATPAARHWLSCEPLLGEIALKNEWLDRGECWHCEGGEYNERDGSNGCPYCGGTGPLVGVDWVIVGGESGRDARPMHPDWAQSLRDQCVEAGVAFHFKQWGEWLPFSQVTTREQREAVSATTIAGKSSYFGACIVPGPQGFKTGLMPGSSGGQINMVGKKVAGRLLDGREWNEYPREVGRG